jgi:hypothetical protein
MLRPGNLTRANSVVNNATRSCLARRGDPGMTYASFPVGLPLFRALSEDLVLYSPRSCRAAIQLGKRCIAIVYSFPRIFRAMSCKAMRIKLLRRPAELTITPRFPCQEFLVLVFFSPVVGFRPQMTLAFISGTRRSYLEHELLTDGRGLNKGNDGSA